MRFKEREDHCLVPRGHREGGLKLVDWLTRQRTKKDNLTSEFRQRLDDIGFVCEFINQQWEDGFAGGIDTLRAIRLGSGAPVHGPRTTEH